VNLDPDRLADLIHALDQWGRPTPPPPAPGDPVPVDPEKLRHALRYFDRMDSVLSDVARAAAHELSPQDDMPELLAAAAAARALVGEMIYPMNWPQEVRRLSEQQAALERTLPLVLVAAIRGRPMPDLPLTILDVRADHRTQTLHLRLTDGPNHYEAILETRHTLGFAIPQKGESDGSVPPANE